MVVILCHGQSMIERIPHWMDEKSFELDYYLRNNEIEPSIKVNIPKRNQSIGSLAHLNIKDNNIYESDPFKGLDPFFQKNLESAILEAVNKDIDVYIVSLWRSPSYQASIQKGYEKGEYGIAYKPATFSYHTSGLAADIWVNDKDLEEWHKILDKWNLWAPIPGDRNHIEPIPDSMFKGGSFQMMFTFSSYPEDNFSGGWNFHSYRQGQPRDIEYRTPEETVEAIKRIELEKQRLALEKQRLAEFNREIDAFVQEIDNEWLDLENELFAEKSETDYWYENFNKSEWNFETQYNEANDLDIDN
ncbi:M15 family metallopeptidase domain-containing protein [Ekhidna sp.]